VSDNTAKGGSYSLKWEYNSSGTPATLNYSRPSAFAIAGDSLRSGGIKIWLYKETRSNGKKMEINLIGGNRRAPVLLGSFEVSLEFTGWRGIWVAYKECVESMSGNQGLTGVSFVLRHADTIYIDLLNFVDRMSFQSRDKIVPPLRKTLYTKKYSFQQSYRWSKFMQNTITDLRHIVISPLKNLSLNHIKSRLRNFYFNETRTSYDDDSDYLMERWKSININIDKANKEYDRLGLKFTTVQGSKTVVRGPPLFCRRSVMGTRTYSTTDPKRKFSFVMDKIMFPLALEFYLKSRQNELFETVKRETPRLNSANLSQALQKICGNRRNRQKEFEDYLNGIAGNPPYRELHVRRSLDYINKVRLQRIINLLDYVEDQGWADGSALGSLDHEMNRDGGGFMQTLFFLNESLYANPANKTRLLKLINTAKWYNDFGEVYQTPRFEYNGTTADKMITMMLFRLMIVLIMPTGTEDEIKARQRDMDALKKWMDSALTINKAFGGVIKPDYTGFHHMAFYGSAYIPQALHTAALVQFLLEGTEFELSFTAKRNLQEGLKTLRVIAVKYSTPSSVGGRFPDFSKAVLAQILPAYAYISISYPGTLSKPPTPGITVSDLTGDAKIFLRLYQTSDDTVKKYLTDGKIHTGKTYMNTLGSVDIMKSVYDRALSKNVFAEPSPEGHWSKNFAALSIHRRKDWAVTVKGFNRFVWDFEGTQKENAHGIFQSHGAMLIANSEESLKAHNVSEGWDWTKIPGATTMNLTLQETLLNEARHFSPQSYAGGVTFKGPEPFSDGAFGMDLHQPDYQFLNRNPHPNIKLSFKKSVFFYQNLLVCLGSNITVQNGGDRVAQTTLFQDRLQNVSSAPAQVERKDKTGKIDYVSIVDTKGNSYFIPRSSVSSLKFLSSNQTSQTPSTKPSVGYYATAWLEHRSPNGYYEYAVYVNTPSYPQPADVFWEYHNRYPYEKPYKVLKQDHEAHVVKFEVTPARWTWLEPFYSYVIFMSKPTLPVGPITEVTNQSRIMIDEDDMYVYLSISYPDLNFPVSNELKALRDIGDTEMFYMESKDVEVNVTLTTNVNKVVQTVVHGLPDGHGYVPEVRVDPLSVHGSPKGNKIVFANLKNGFSVEIKLSK